LPAELTEEPAHVADQELGGLHGREVADRLELGPVDDVVLTL
jgi:hypothetical protein